MNNSDTTKDIIIPSEYARLLDSDWREACIYGGRNSLKSHTVARILLIRAMSKKGRAGCFREYQNSIADSSKSLLENLIDEHKLAGFHITKDSIIYKPTGYDFIFRGLHNNVQSVKSIEGLTEAWIEEAQTITEASLEILTPTVRLDGSQIFYTYNRLRDKDPIHQRLVVEGRPNSLILNVNYPTAIKYGWMADHLIQEMESDKKHRPEVYKHKWLGMPSTLKGLVFPDFEKIEELPPEADYLGTGLDYGYTNDPTAAIDIYKWNNSYILDELLYQRGMKNKEIARVLNGRGTPLVVPDSAEPKSNDELRDEGLTIIPAVKGKDSVNNGIQLLQGLKIHYTARSHNIEEEVLNYSWKVDKEDKSLNIPIDAYNHAMDASRYFITHKESFKPIDYGGVEDII
jgi:phage terminase large subunit